MCSHPFFLCSFLCCVEYSQTGNWHRQCGMYEILPRCSSCSIHVAHLSFLLWNHLWHPDQPKLNNLNSHTLQCAAVSQPSFAHPSHIAAMLCNNSFTGPFSGIHTGTDGVAPFRAQHLYFARESRPSSMAYHWFLHMSHTHGVLSGCIMMFCLGTLVFKRLGLMRGAIDEIHNRPKYCKNFCNDC